MGEGVEVGEMWKRGTMWRVEKKGGWKEVETGRGRKKRVWRRGSKRWEAERWNEEEGGGRGGDGRGREKD